MTKGVQEPDEEELRDLAKRLGAAKKELMTLGRDLMVNQPADTATEAHELISEAGEAIKANREIIKAVLGGLGAASDISEVSSLVMPPRPPPARPSMGNLVTPAWATQGNMAPSAWPPQGNPAPLAWAPQDMPPRSTPGGTGDELASLMRGLMGAQANDSGWPTFSGRYAEYPRFRKEWWAYRHTYHGHVRDELVCRSLKERSLASSIKILVNDIEDLQEAWNPLDTCFDRPEKYIAEALEPIVKFRSYKMFDNSAIREFYSLLREAMMGAKKAGLLHRLINDQTLPSILAKMPSNDWHQWARERPMWMREATEEAFWGFVDQKWRDALNVAAAEPAGWGAGGGRVATHETDKKGPAEAARKLAQAAIHVTAADEKPQRQGESGRRCIFMDMLGCSGRHPLWKCGRFGNIWPKERERIIEDNRLCAFCLLHDRARTCAAKERQDSPACYAPGCKGRHIRKLHEFLKDMYGEENQVHLVQGDGGWEEPEGTWAIDEAEEEEAVIVNTVQQAGSSWRETDDSWLELNGGEASGIYCVGACHGENGQMPRAEAGQPRETLYLYEEEGVVEADWWSPDPTEMQFGEGETEYLFDLLMGGSGAGEDRAEPARTPAAPSTMGHAAGGEGATGQGTQPQEEIREGKPATGKGSRKAAARREKTSNEGASRGEDKPSTGSGAEGADARDRRGPRGWRPWWPNSRKEEESPDPPRIQEQRSRTAQKWSWTRTQECDWE